MAFPTAVNPQITYDATRTGAEILTESPAPAESDEILGVSAHYPAEQPQESGDEDQP